MKYFKKAAFLPILMGLSVLTGCATKYPNWSTMDPGPKPDYESAQEQSKEIIAEGMFDPDSAKFKNWTPFYKMIYSYGPFKETEPLWALCVDVNAKNRLGGYVGYDTYYVKFRDGKAINEPGVGYDNNDYHCKKSSSNPDRQ